MALIKQYTLVDGQTGEYWKIAESRPDFIAKKTAVALGFWLNKEYRQAVDSEGREINILNTLCQPIIMIIDGVFETREQLYTEIKKIGIFVDAEDDI